MCIFERGKLDRNGCEFYRYFMENDVMKMKKGYEDIINNSI